MERSSCPFGQVRCGPWMVLCALAMLSGCQSEEQCPPALELTRATYAKCLAKGDWIDLGVHEVDGSVRSLGWLDHGHSSSSSPINWIPDDSWTRDVVVLEHLSGTVETSVDDPVVSHLKLYCEWDRSILEGNRLIVMTAEEEGSPPELLRNCEAWPVTIEALAHEAFLGECYATRFCPMGTVCMPGTGAAVCPETGVVCAEPGFEERALDLDTDGTPNCEDDDVDGDGLLGEEEASGSVTGFPTDAWNEDTDGDGLLDSDDEYPTQECPGGPLFFDDFSGDASSWSVVSGEWSIAGGEYRASPDESILYVSWIGVQSWTDYVVETWVWHEGWEAPAGVVARALEGTGDYYYAGIEAGYDSAEVGVVDAAGGMDDLAETRTELELGGWHRVGLDVRGETLELSVGGKPVITTTDQRHLQGGVGVFSYLADASFRYVLVCR